MARFKILKTLGEGAMGRVALAEDAKVGTRVALKILPPSTQPEDLSALRNEVALLSKLSHPSLVRLYDYEDDPELGPVFSMEAVEGRPLDESLREAIYDRIEDLFVQFCRALHYLHARGLYHGDIKPPNALVTKDGRLKILDFGLAGTAGVGDRPAAGTFLYMAPETFGGVRDACGDLFSLGVVFYEILAGRPPYPHGTLGLKLEEKAKPLAGLRPNLPAHFCELIDRLVRLNPEKRPRSALALIKYLNRRRKSPYAIADEVSSDAVLQRIPWIERPEERAFRKVFDKHRRSPTLQFVDITGPTGSGRTRLVEETRWPLKFDGASVVSCGPANHVGREGISDGAVVFLEDLHEWSEEHLKALRLFFLSLTRWNVAACVVLEHASDLSGPALESLIKEAASLGALQRIELGDLSRENALTFAQAATRDWDLQPTAAQLETVVSVSGGRALLMIEALRSLFAGKEVRVAKDLETASKTRIAALPEPAKKALALVAVHPQALTAADLEALPAETPWTDVLGHGWLKAVAEGLQLAHPALRDVYLRAFDGAEVLEAHHVWLSALLGREEDAASILHHAAGAGDLQIAKKWTIPGLSRLFAEQKLRTALDLCERLLLLNFEPEQHAVILAYKAPILFRLGRFEKALESYDRWKGFRPDRETDLVKLRHHLYTAQVLMACGREKEAAVRLKTCLSLGATAKDAVPHHARASLLLASLEEKGGGLKRARRILEDAKASTAKDSLLAGERELKLGELDQKEGLHDDAKKRFEAALEHFEEAKNPQAMALVWNGLGMLARETGYLGAALEAMDQAIALAERGGEILQIARYRENRALILLDGDDYGGAQKEMDAAQDALTVFGEEEDRALVAEHRRDFSKVLASQAPPKFFESWVSWKRARSSLDALGDALGKKPDEVALNEAFAAIRSIESPRLRAKAFAELVPFSQVFAEFANQEYHLIHQSLPEDLKMEFEKSAPLKPLESSLAEALRGSAAKPGAIPEDRFKRFCEITRKISIKNNLLEILGDVLEAAIGLMGAERGFVILKGDARASKSILPGFEIKAARHLNQNSLKEGDFKFSLTTVQQVLKQGTYILTDNAQADPRLKEKKSVVMHQLKSILVVPLELEGQVLGAVYLDHRYQMNCFKEEDVALLNAFAAQSALAIQKARMMDELASAKQKLEEKVKVQEEKIEFLTDELEHAREGLRYGYDEIIGKSPSMMKVFKLLDHVTETAIPVWILGESGTGKELIARSLHFNSPRKDKPFITENVSAIPETLLESELFGHKKGAFTHADRDRVGLFEQASGGTLFLDEIADMSSSMQSKLLRVLQEGEVRPVGSGRKVKIDVRLVTASNKDLRQMVSQGKFRQDLFYRINGLMIPLPALRSRKEDIPLIAKHLVQKISREFGLEEATIEPEALRLLMKHTWPGNVRELEAVLRNALLFAKGKPVSPKFISFSDGDFQEAAVPVAIEPARERATLSASSRLAAPHAAEENLNEKEMILDALRQNDMDKEAAAKSLAMSLRTLYNRMDSYKIPKKRPMLARYLGI